MLSEARREFHRALALAEEDRSLDPLSLVPLLNDIGVTGKYRGDFDEAASAYDRALKVVDTGEVGTAVLRAMLLHNIAGLAHARGEPAAAESAAREGIALRLAAATVEPLDLAADQAALAAILVDLGQVLEAQELLTRVLRVFESTYGPEHYEVGVTLHNLGSLQHRCGNFKSAATTLTRAVKIKRAVLAPSHPDLAISLHNLACAQAKLGHNHRAAESLREVLTLLSGSVADGHPTLLSARNRLSSLSSAINIDG